jgi:hypothetical protein
MKSSKSILILFSFFFSILTTAQSEKGFSTRVNSGNNIGVGNVNYLHALITGIANVDETSASTSTTERIKINLGKGLNVGLQYHF